MSSKMNVWVDVADDVAFYLESAARIRKVSRTQVLRKVIEIILKDQLILSILDDADVPSDKTASRRNKGRGYFMPKDRTFDALKRVPSIATRKPLKGSRSYQPTSTELEAELRQAVLNTGGEPIT